MIVYIKPLLWLAIVFGIVQCYSCSFANNNAPFFKSAIAYAGADGLHYVQLSNKNDKLLVKGNIQRPVFTSNASYILYYSDTTLCAYNLTTNKSRELLEDATAFCYYEQNDTVYSASPATGLVNINLTNGVATQVFDGEKDVRYSRIIVSPDLSMLCYERYYTVQNAQRNSGVYLYNISKQFETAVSEQITPIRDMVTPGVKPYICKWSTNQNYIMLWLIPNSYNNVDPVSVALYSLSDRQLILLDDVIGKAMPYSENVNFSANGYMAIASIKGTETKENIKIVKIPELTIEPLKLPDIESQMPCLSGIGTSILFSGLEQNELCKIYLYDKDNCIRLSEKPNSRDEYPVFLHNNKYVLYQSYNNEKLSVSVLDIESKEHTLITDKLYMPQINLERITWRMMFDFYDNSDMLES